MKCITGKLTFFMVLLLAALAMGNRFERSDVNRQLKELCKARISAFAERNVGKLGEVCVAEYRLITQSGGRMTLDEIGKSISGQKRKLSSFTLYSFQSYVANDETMAFSVAEVTEEVIADNKTPVTNNLLVTEVYVKESGKWKIQLTHVSQKMCAFPE